MSPTSFQYEHNNHHHHHHHHLIVKQEASSFTTNNTNNNEDTHKCHNNNVYGRMSPPSLKINRDSHHIIKKSSPSFTISSSFSNNNKLHQHHKQREPVIIYTHSPKVIHTNPRDFMALVQKLTGMSRPNEAAARDMGPGPGPGPVMPIESPQLVKCSASGTGNNNNSNSTDDESSSVVTDENCSSNNSTTVGGDAVGNNPFVGPPPLFDAPPSSPNLPIFMNSSMDLLCCGDPSIYDYMDFNLPFNQIT